MLISSQFFILGGGKWSAIHHKHGTCLGTIQLVKSNKTGQNICSPQQNTIQNYL